MEIFKLYNNNPNNNFTQDCIIRALSEFLNKPYFEIVDDLVKVYKQTGFHIADSVCLTYYINNLKNIQEIEIGLQNKISVSTLCKNIINKNFTQIPQLTVNNCDKILAFLGNTHLTFIQKGVIMDTWNCSSLIVNKLYVFRGDELV